MYKSFLRLGLSLVIIFFVYSIGFYAGTESIPSVYQVEGVQNKTDAQTDINFGIFWDAWKNIEAKHVERGNLDKQDMVYGAISGMVRSLKDPYTSFFPPADSKMLQDDISGSFSGIGAEIGFRKGILTIIAPLPNSPAKGAGILSGDKIFKVNGTSTQDMSLEEAVRNIRGEKGTQVILTVFRDEFEQVKDFSIIRNTIIIPSMEWEIREGDVAYIKLFNFTGSIDTDFLKAARGILRRGAKKVILDLRNNPGGFLDSAVELASYFIPKGDIVAIEHFGNGKGDNEFRSKGYNYFQDMPIVVLINEGSASASEILAGALRDNRNIRLVGETTFGKGSVQEVIHLPENTLLKITVAKWLIPSGVSIQDGGIEPDEKVEMTVEDMDKQKDPQLDKAFEIINNISL